MLTASDVRAAFDAFDGGATLDEVKVKIAGNLCVNKGPNTGGGFTPCSTGAQVKEMTREATIDTIRRGIPGSVMNGWFRNADKNYKPRLVAAIKADGGKVHNAGLNLFHQEYQRGTGKRVSFTSFMDTPITLYRGGNLSDAPFTSFSYDRGSAAKFLKQGEKIRSIKIRPRDTLGMYQTIAEGEVLVPIDKLKESLDEARKRLGFGGSGLQEAQGSHDGRRWGVGRQTPKTRFDATALKDRLLKKALRTLVVKPDGSLISKKTGKKLPGANLAGYRVHSLTVDGKRVQARAHRVVALAKHGHIPKGAYVDHKDRDRSNNAPSNLKVTTPEGNAQNRAQDGATPRLKEMVRAAFDAFDGGATLDEVKVKIAGNLCVNKGPGSGGGFTPCTDFPAVKHLGGPFVSSMDIKSPKVYDGIGRLAEYKKVEALLKSDGYTRADRGALQRYTGGFNPDELESPYPAPFWVMIGRLARDGANAHEVNDHDKAIFKSAAEETMRVMQHKLPKVDDGIVYRGFNENRLALNTGKEFVSDSFLSGSYHPGTAARFASKRERPAIMRIRGKSTFIGNASGFDEHEGVFLPGQRFKVVGVHRGVTTDTDRIDYDHNGKQKPGPTVTVYDVVAIGEPGRIKIREAIMEAKKPKKTESQTDRFTSTEFIRVVK